MLAAMNGHVPAVKLLLDMGSDINAQIETNRNTALTLACFQGRAEVVSLLLDRKANVEHRAKVRDRNHTATDSQHSDVEVMLRELIIAMLDRKSTRLNSSH